MQRLLPHQTDQRFVVFAATGTDLIFNRGIELPGFASFPLLEDATVRPIIVDQMRDLTKVAADFELGCIIDTPTWMANRDRAAPLGYDAERLAAVNRKAVNLMCGLRAEAARDDVLADKNTVLDALTEQELRQSEAGRTSKDWGRDAAG